MKSCKLKNYHVCQYSSSLPKPLCSLATPMLHYKSLMCPTLKKKTIMSLWCEVDLTQLACEREGYQKLYLRHLGVKLVTNVCTFITLNYTNQ